MQFSTSSWIEYWTVQAVPLFNWKKNEETASNWCKVYRAEVQPYIKWFYLWGTSSEHAAQYQSILYWSCTWQFYSRTCMHTEWNKWWHFDYFPDHSHFVLSQFLHQLTASVLHFTVMTYIWHCQAKTATRLPSLEPPICTSRLYAYVTQLLNLAQSHCAQQLASCLVWE